MSEQFAVVNQEDLCLRCGENERIELKKRAKQSCFVVATFGLRMCSICFGNIFHTIHAWLQVFAQREGDRGSSR